ncbi:PLP-dependent aminotransferase family protein [Deinococcus sonorensis]|uniref:PLP-dependent aminotransferase family protein n=2 Tax=Deinococcus sonorensis TaxID=309891 RepID=A0AAU7U8Z9_9DEIO
MDPLRWSTLLHGWNLEPGVRYRQLAQALQRAIQDGRLAGQERLPAERELASLLGISRSTVVTGYDLLALEGWLERRQGSGTRVTAAAPRAHPVLTLRTPVQAATAPPGELDLTIAVPSLTEAHRRRLQAALGSAFEESRYHPLGLPALRVCLADHYTRQGVPTRPEQIIITSGAQQAIALIAQTFLNAGDRALLETPTYFGAIDVFRAAGAELQGLPVGPDGVAPHALEAGLQGQPRLVFLTPTFQNPTGTVMPASVRREVAALLDRAGVPTIEDETLSELDLDRPAPPPVASHTPEGPVISVGSLSKLFWAGLRVGWLRSPERYLAPLSQAKTLSDFGTSLPAQAIALDLLRQLPALREERRALVRPARDTLVTLLREQLPDWAFLVPEGGQFLWVELPTDSATRFTLTARRAGIRLFPGASMGVTPLPDRSLRLPFTLPPEHLPEAVGRLRRAWAWHLAEDRAGPLA